MAYELSENEEEVSDKSKIERLSHALTEVETTKTPGKLDTWSDVSEFIFAGNATFTLVSLKTGVRFTYKVRVKKEDVERSKHVGLTGMTFDSVAPVDVTYFVNLLRGPNNEQDFAYMGIMRKPGQFFWTQASGKVGRQAPAHKAIVWMLDALTCGRDVLGRQLEVWHEGRCGRCGRKLTVPESIAAGIGPECRAHGLVS